jgi:pimeloyl-ACP methyl ester carboxylesterase
MPQAPIGWMRAGPSAQVADDAVLGLGLYRANLGPRARRNGPPPVTAEPTSVPVRLLVALDDPFVTPALLDGVEELAPGLVRTELTGGHWLPRSRPATVAAEVRAQVVAAAGERPG